MKTSIDARGLAKNDSHVRSHAGGGAKDPTAAARATGSSRGVEGGRSRAVPSRGEGGGRGRAGGAGRSRAGVRSGGGGGLGAAAATRIISTGRAPFWIEKPSRDPRKARGCGGASRGVPGARVSSAARRAGTHLGLGVRADDGADAARATAAREGGARGHADAAAREARASARGVARRCRDGRDAGDGGDRLARHGSTV